MDDDVEVNSSLLQSLLFNYRHYSKVLIGRVYLDNRVVTNNQSKWSEKNHWLHSIFIFRFLSHSEYKSSHLGEYLQGMSYAISGDLLSIMKENIDKVQYLWVRWMKRKPIEELPLDGRLVRDSCSTQWNIFFSNRYFIPCRISKFKSWVGWTQKTKRTIDVYALAPKGGVSKILSTYL